MNINDFPKKGRNEVPTDFFENQFNSIVSRTLEIENWNLPLTKNIEAQFKVPDGYWLQMEDGIRSIIKPKTLLKYKYSKAWQLATVLGSVFIFAFTFFFLFPGTNSQTDNWSAKLDGLSNEEILLGIDIEKPEIQELTELVAAANFQEKALDLQNEEFTNQEVEETLENINTSELLNDLEIN